MEVTPTDEKEFLRECGRRLREKRESFERDGQEKGLTLEAAASLIGRAGGKATWRRWEQGSPPGAHTAARVARALGCTVEDIWGNAPLPDADHDEAADDDEEGAS